MPTAPASTFPDLDGETSFYRAAVWIGDFESPPVVFPGAHRTFASARARARCIQAALLAAGETGLWPHVLYGGDRPAGFPRTPQGVRV